MTKFFTVKEVAETYNIREIHVRDLIRARRIRAIKQDLDFGGLWEYLIPEQDLDVVREYSYFRDMRPIKALNQEFLDRLDELEEQMYDNICFIGEIRRKLEKGEL